MLLSAWSILTAYRKNTEAVKGNGLGGEGQQFRLPRL
jgi:hypothetical protein